MNYINIILVYLLFDKTESQSFPVLTMNLSKQLNRHDGNGFFFKNVEFNGVEYQTIKEQTKTLSGKLSQYGSKYIECTTMHQKMCDYVTKLRLDLSKLQEIHKQVEKMLETMSKLSELTTTLPLIVKEHMPLSTNHLDFLNVLFLELNNNTELKDYSESLTKKIRHLKCSIPKYRKTRDSYYQKKYYVKHKIKTQETELYNLTSVKSNVLLSMPQEIWFLIFSQLYNTRSSSAEYANLCIENNTHLSVFLTCKYFYWCMKRVQHKFHDKSPYARLVNGWNNLGPDKLMYDKELYFVADVQRCTLIDSISYSYLNFLFHIDEFYLFSHQAFSKTFNNRGYFFSNYGTNYTLTFRKSLLDYLGAKIKLVNSKIVEIFMQRFANSYLFDWLLLGSCIFRIDSNLNCFIYWNTNLQEFESCPANQDWNKDIKAHILTHFPRIDI